MTAATVLVFDGHCGFCTRAVAWLLRLDRRHRLIPLPYQLPGVPQRYGLAPDDCRTAAWTFTPDGRWFRGAGAINAALATAVGNRLPLWIYRLPVIRWAQDAAYDWIARNRRLFPGVTPWCSAHPDAGGDADTPPLLEGRVRRRGR